MLKLALCASTALTSPNGPGFPLGRRRPRLVASTTATPTRQMSEADIALVTSSFAAGA